MIFQMNHSTVIFVSIILNLWIILTNIVVVMALNYIGIFTHTVQKKHH